MDYEKKYKEIFESVRHLLDENPSDEGIKNWVIDNFPELKESEDERIRKAILEGLIDCRDAPDLEWSDFGGIEIDDCIAWVEKQGGNLQFWRPTKEQYEALDYAYNRCSDTERGNYYEGVLETLIEDLHRLEKQGEQKHANKVEPKFHEGEWVVDNECGKLNQIDSVRDKGYDFANGDYMSYESAHKELRLWTIQDAKDGDVLTTSAGAFIYNGNNGGGSCPGSYCGINTLGKFQTCVGSHWTTKKVYPATKEQRDTLFAKMKEAGYEWDAEKKELKEIEQKPAWSKEDEKVRKELTEFIESASGGFLDATIPCKTFGKWATWLERQCGNSEININKMVMEYMQTKDGDFGRPLNCQIRAYRQGINDTLNLSLGVEKQGEQEEDATRDKIAEHLKKLILDQALRGMPMLDYEGRIEEEVDFIISIAKKELKKIEQLKKM